VTLAGGILGCTFHKLNIKNGLNIWKQNLFRLAVGESNQNTIYQEL